MVHLISTILILTCDWKIFCMSDNSFFFFPHLLCLSIVQRTILTSGQRCSIVPHWKKCSRTLLKLLESLWNVMVFLYYSIWSGTLPAENVVTSLWCTVVFMSYFLPAINFLYWIKNLFYFCRLFTFLQFKNNLN